jgi:hypothetical protein
MPVQLTGTDWLIGAGKATVGWPDALLHSRTAPADPASYPDPVTVTTVPPFRQVPGFAVRLGGPADVAEAGMQDANVVVVVGTVVVVVVVVVTVPAGKEISAVACTGGVEETPYAMTQEKPAESCAAVGGHG